MDNREKVDKTSVVPFDKMWKNENGVCVIEDMLKKGIYMISSVWPTNIEQYIEELENNDYVPHSLRCLIFIPSKEQNPFKLETEIISHKDIKAHRIHKDYNWYRMDIKKLFQIIWSIIPVNSGIEIQVLDNKKLLNHIFPNGDDWIVKESTNLISAPIVNNHLETGDYIYQNCSATRDFLPFRFHYDRARKRYVFKDRNEMVYCNNFEEFHRELNMHNIHVTNQRTVFITHCKVYK